MKANKVVVAVLSIVAAAGLGLDGWSLNSTDDKRTIIAFGQREMASARWALGGEVRASTVCEIFKRQRSMDGQKVHLRARFFSDQIEHSGLIDAQCPRESIGIANGGELLDDAQGRRFEALISAQPGDGPHLTEVDVEATVESPPRRAGGSDSVIVAVHRYIGVADAGVDPLWIKFAQGYGIK
jgi:hypothetical protein